jgi:hypothetical protein
MTFLSPEDYERIGHLEADIQAARADIEAYKASHPVAEHPGEQATAEALAEWEAGKTEMETFLAQKQAYLTRLQRELKSIG